MTQLQQILADLESVSFQDISCFPVDTQHIVANNIEVLQDQLRKLLSQPQAAPLQSTANVETLFSDSKKISN